MIHHYNQKVRSADIDIGGVLYHGRYLYYYDEARQDQIASAGLPYGNLIASGKALVVADLSLRFFAPVLVEEVIHIYTQVEEVGNRLLKFRQVMTTKEIDPERAMAASQRPKEAVNQAEIKMVHVDIESMKPSFMHSDLRNVGQKIHRNELS